MRLLVVGGRLQGTEAVYLAAKAGYATTLVDRFEASPAAGLADRVVVADITADEGLARSLVTSCDAVLPACEDVATLEWLAERVPAWGVPLVFDMGAHRVTRSKLESHRLFDRLGVPRPRPWPACAYPAVVKPDTASGSEGVTVAGDAAAVAKASAALAAAGYRPVVEEWVSGPSLSLEVLAWQGQGVPLEVTGLEFDAVHDCKRVVAPVGEHAAAAPAAGSQGPPGSGLQGAGPGWEDAVGPGVLERFAALSTRLAAGLGLSGLMDVEVMVRDGCELRVLEIDARLPSQTPTVVYWSSGLNIVALLVETACRGRLEAVRRGSARACVCQHVRARRGRLEVVGEHALARARPLRLISGFHGADEALTDRLSPGAPWVATLVTTGATVAEARSRGEDVIRDIARLDGLAVVPDQAQTRSGMGQ